MTVLNVVNGYQHPSVVPDEYGTYIEKMNNPISPEIFLHKVDENLNHIGWIKNFSRSWQVKEKDPRHRASDKKFPDQVPVKNDAKQKFIKDLASEAVSFEKLVQIGIPHGYKGEYLIGELASNYVPMMRATWFIKIVQLNASAQSHANRNTKEDWTDSMANFLIGTVKELGSAVVGKNDAEPEKEGLFQKLDEYDTTVLLYILFPYLEEICRDNARRANLISIVFSKLQHVESQTQKFPVLCTILCDFVRFLLVLCPEHLLRIPKEDIIRYAHMNIEGNGIIQTKEIEKLISRFENIFAKENASFPCLDKKELPFGSSSLRNSLNKVSYFFSGLNELFENFKEIYELAAAHSSSSYGGAIAEACEWAVCEEHSSISWRIFIVLALLKRFDQHIKTKGKRHSSVVPQQMLRFLQQYKPKDSEYKQIMLLFGEAQRNGLFSHETFSRYLISTGAISGKNDLSKQLLGYLHHMPVHGEQHQHNQRAMLLQQSPAFPFERQSEVLLIEGINDAVQRTFFAHETSNAASCSDILASLPAILTKENKITHIVFVFEQVPQYITNVCCSAFLENLMESTSINSQQGCSVAQFQFSLFLFEFAQDYSSLTQFIIHALRNWKNNFKQVISAMRKHVNFFFAQEHLQELIDLLPLRMNESQANRELSLQFIVLLLSLKLEDIANLSIPAIMKTDAHSLRSLDQIHATAIRQGETNWSAIPDLISSSSNTTMAEIAGKIPIKDFRDLSDIFSCVILQIIKHRDIVLSQPVFELYGNFLMELTTTNNIANHSEWFCHQFNREFIDYCTTPPSSICQLFSDNQTAIAETIEIFSDFLGKLISIGFLSLQQFFKSSVIRIISSGKSVSIPAIHKLYEKLVLLDNLPANSSVTSFLSFSSRKVINSRLSTEFNLIAPSTMLQILCFLFTTTTDRENPIFHAISTSTTIQEFVRSTPPSIIRASMRHSKIPSPTQSRFAFHKIFFGSTPFLLFEEESIEQAVQQTLQHLLSAAERIPFELVKLSVDFVFEDWRQSQKTKSDSVFFSYVTDQILANLCSHTEQAEMFGALARSIGKPLESVLLERLSTLLSINGILLGEQSMANELAKLLNSNSEDFGDEEMNEVIERSEIIEYQLLDAIEVLVVSCLPSGAGSEGRNKFLTSMLQQLEKWNEHTKNIDICDEEVPLDLIQSNLLLRLRLIRALMDSVNIEKFPQNSETLALLLLRLCDNRVVLYYDDGENLFEYICRMLEVICDSLNSEKPQRRDNSRMQFIAQFKAKMREIFVNLEGLDVVRFARLDQILPRVVSQKQAIVFKCPDPSDAEKEIEISLDPWALLESYPNGQLSPTYFSGNTIERTALAYMKSPFDGSGIEKNDSLEDMLE